MKIRLALTAWVLAMAASLALAEEMKTDEVTLTGSLTCAQCNLHEKVTKAHQDVLIVTEGDKDVEYYCTNLSKHPNVCHTKLKGVKVTGVVTEADGKKWIAATKLELPAK